MSKKIAFISVMGGYPWGGSEYLWAMTAEQAQANGNEVCISIYDWSVNHARIARLQNKGAKIFPRPRSFSPTSRIINKFTQTIPAFKRFQSQSPYQPIFDCQADVICINQGASYDIIFHRELIDLLLSYSIPYVIICQFNTDCKPLDNDNQAILQEVFTKAASVIFVSQHNLKLAERYLAKSLTNAIVMQNPVNMHDLSRIEWCKDTQKVCFASVARLETLIKGQDVLFEAISSSVWQERNWQCNLYGSGPDEVYLKALVEHYGIADKVKFMGYISDVRSIWAENHLLVMPSRAEGTPLSLVEAMLCGRPAVVSDVGGNTEWIEESKTGFIAEAPTPKAFGAALERAWQHRENWQQMGVNAHEYATAKFDSLPDKRLLEIILNGVNKK